MRVLLHYAATPSLESLLRELAPKWLQLQWIDHADDEGFARLLPETQVLWPYAALVNGLASVGIPRQELAVCLSVLKRLSANLERNMRESEARAASGRTRHDQG